MRYIVLSIILYVMAVFPLQVIYGYTDHRPLIEAMWWAYTPVREVMYYMPKKFVKFWIGMEYESQVYGEKLRYQRSKRERLGL